MVAARAAMVAIDVVGAEVKAVREAKAVIEVKSVKGQGRGQSCSESDRPKPKSQKHRYLILNWTKSPMNNVSRLMAHSVRH